MTRKIILAVILTAVVFNFSFSSGTASNVIAIPKPPQKTVRVCVNLLGCKFCGAQVVANGLVTICLDANCGGGTHFICVSFGTYIHVTTGVFKVDTNSISIDYSSPQLKAQVDEAALTADFIEQVETELNK